MNIDEYISLCRTWGYPIKRIHGYYFYPQKLRNYSFPHFRKIPVDDALVKYLKWRYLMSTLFIDAQRKNICEFILDRDNYDLDSFGRKTKNRIKKSLRNCTFKRPDLGDMLTAGLAINQQMVKRQSRKESLLTDSNLWKNYITSLYTNNVFFFMGAYYHDRMVGYMVVYKLENRYNIHHASIDREDSETTSPMCGLIFTMVNWLIQQEGRVSISYGLDTFAGLPELNRFKRNMLFNAIPSSRGYIINPLLMIFFRLIIFFNISVLRKKNIRNPITRMVVRFYQGKRLLDRELERNTHQPGIR